MWKTILSAIVCCLALVAAVAVYAQKVGVKKLPEPVKADIEEGDIVVVTQQSADLQVGTTTVASVRAGQELQVRKIEGQWLWTTIELSGKPVRGWIARDAVKLVRKAAASGEPQTATEKDSTDASEAVGKTLKAYAEAFNKNDARALAAHWAPKAVHVDRDTGERLEGREAIQADFEATFKARPGLRLTTRIDSVRLVKPDVATVEGKATVFTPGEDANEGVFSVVLVKQGAQWLIDSVQEAGPPSPTASEALRELEWLVGHWVDKSDSVQVDTTVRWAANRSFLVRSYVVTMEEDETHQGTQIIGWDPINKRIRSWTFDSDGSFGEETWSKNGDEWLIRMSRTMADGGSASGTQVIARQGDDTITVQAIAREIDGEPAPAGDPVIVERVPEAKVDPKQ